MFLGCGMIVHDVVLRKVWKCWVPVPPHRGCMARLFQRTPSDDIFPGAAMIHWATCMLYTPTSPRDDRITYNYVKLLVDQFLVSSPIALNVATEPSQMWIPGFGPAEPRSKIFGHFEDGNSNSGRTIANGRCRLTMADLSFRSSLLGRLAVVGLLDACILPFAFVPESV